MKFTVLYENTKERREHVLNFLRQAIAQNIDLTRTTIDHPICSVRSLWPDDASLFSLPLNIQCEEVEYKDGNFVTYRQLVIDVEVAMPPPPPPPPEEQKAESAV